MRWLRQVSGMIGWLYHKKEFRELRKEIREIKQQPTINVTQQLAVHGTSPNEDGNAVMSKGGAVAKYL